MCVCVHVCVTCVLDALWQCKHKHTSTGGWVVNMCVHVCVYRCSCVCVCVCVCVCACVCVRV